MKDPVRNYASLIGIPYDKMNCWEAARCFYKECFDTELKHYCSEAPSDRSDIRSLIYTNRGDFSELGIDAKRKMIFGDLILFKVKGIESHIGVYVGPGKFFHSSKTTGSCIDRIEKWDNLIVGIYRMKSEAT